MASPDELWLVDFGSDGPGAPRQLGADLGPLAVCARLGIAPGGTSLDNTVRVVDPADREVGIDDRGTGREPLVVLVQPADVARRELGVVERLDRAPGVEVPPADRHPLPVHRLDDLGRAPARRRGRTMLG